MVKLLKILLSEAIVLGISNEAKLLIEEFIEYNECDLAFDQVLYELHENSIPITLACFYKITEIAGVMKIEEDDYAFIKELILDP
ncbi:MAG: hypothetical protein H7Y04_04840 [Verrucomicrobia bacterium]|nr:hypothetical protein [Cytophagales bacterium]